MMAGVRPSVCLYVCLSRASTWLRTERPRKPKIGRMEAHHTGNPWTYLEVKRSKVKVTRPINAVTDIALSNTRREVKLLYLTPRVLFRLFYLTPQWWFDTPVAQVGGITIFLKLACLKHVHVLISAVHVTMSTHKSNVYSGNDVST